MSRSSAGSSTLAPPASAPDSDEAHSIDVAVDGASIVAQERDDEAYMDELRAMALGGRRGVWWVARLFPTSGDRLSMMYNVVVVSVTLGILVKHADGSCTRLTVWLIVNAALTLGRGLGKVLKQSAGPRVSRVLGFTVKLLTTAAMGWFITGLVFVIVLPRSAAGARCPPPISKLALSLVVIEMTMLVLSLLLGLLIFLFAPHPTTRSFSVPGISREALNKIPAFQYDGEAPAHDATTCAICLCDFEPGEMLRELPCAAGAHTFHATCIDTWLAMKSTCPICREDPTARDRPPNTTSLTVPSESAVPDVESDILPPPDGEAQGAPPIAAASETQILPQEPPAAETHFSLQQPPAMLPPASATPNNTVTAHVVVDVVDVARIVAQQDDARSSVG